MKTDKNFNKNKVFLVVLLAFFCQSIAFAQTDTLIWMNNPAYGQNSLKDVWGKDGQAFAVGENGTFLRFNGTDWTQISIPYTDHLTDLWGASVNDIWIVGGVKLFHYNGATFTEVSIGATHDFRGITGISASDIYAYGDYGSVFHYNGSAWSYVPNAYTDFVFDDAFYTTGNDVYFVGGDIHSPYSGRILHYNGSTFTELRDGGLDLYRRIWSPDNNIFYISGLNFYAFNRTTSDLTTIHSGEVVDFYGFSASDMLFLGLDTLFRYNGSACSSLSPVSSLYALYAPDGDKSKVYCVGYMGQIYRLDLTSGVEEIESLQDFSIYPNPATDQVSINLSFTTSTNVNVAVYDIAGQQVVNVFQGFVGNETLKFNGSSLPPGFYFIRVEADGGVTSKKLVIQ